MKKTVAFIFVASTLLLAGCCTVHHHTIWEYQTVSDIHQVNQLAGQGWILVGLAPVANGASPGTLYYVMKHRKQ